LPTRCGWSSTQLRSVPTARGESKVRGHANSYVSGSLNEACLGERGFSLIEIMVAVSLLAAIIIGLLAMFYHVQRAFRSGVAQADVMEGGRATMSLLVRELQEMTACQVDFVTNCLIAPALGVTPTFQDLPSGSARSNFLQDICFLSRVNDDWIGTGYRVDNAVSGVGTLYRLVDRWSGDTLPTLNSQSLSNHSALLCNSTTANTNYHRVLDGVVSLTITPYDTNGLLYFNTNAADLLINHGARVYGFAKDALPAYVDIELAVLEPSPWEKFKVRYEIDSANGPTPNRATNYLAKQIGSTQVFRQRIPIRPSATDIGVRY
ncbi:MAG TPA: prepilin-type N-terminal cleavage/methylation domain-containing protein, partial [Candidatus Binatia bacterium]|nr:prepilin-type N-terminal cleavage/methylation domain-containing protein [Candidatus Binatia bacterium]